MTDFLVPMLVFTSVIVGALVAFSFGRSYFAKLDQRRIAENVLENGGELIGVTLHSPSRIGNRTDKVYDVDFKTRNGKRITTMCMTSVSSGVVWINDKPPVDGVEISDEAMPTEAIKCLQCGARMPPQATHCQQCGWSYKQE